MLIEISASIVLYNTEEKDVENVVKSMLNNNLNLKLFLIDNSKSDCLSFMERLDERILYIHNPSNPGFGSGHNIAILKAMTLGSKYHFIVNPDISFTEDVIKPMVDFMANDEKIGMIMPQVLNKDGSVQNLPKLLPSPFSVLWRKIKLPHGAYMKFINIYELREVPKDFIYNTPILSGCFTLLNLNAINKVGMYDHKFFMYFEDWDLSRRIHKHYKTIYFPKVSVVHEYESGANKNKKLFKIFVKSAITYFNKWGWFFDSERKKINAQSLSQFK